VALIVGSYLLQLLFDLIPFPAQPQKLFLLVDGRDFGMTLEWYAYFCGEHLSRMSLFYAVYLYTDWELMDNLFVVELMDLIDFMMIDNKAWTVINGFELEFNYGKIALVLYFVFRHWRSVTS
jgi:hypothetical protein